jgi:NAD(P)H-dependent FMN reductase
MRALNLPVIAGTARKGRHTRAVAEAIAGDLAARPGVTVPLIDIARLRLPTDDAGEAVKDGDFAAAMRDADGIVLVVPEYNHSFPGLLKHVLDSCLSEYVHKAAGIVGVSSGPFGGTRVVQSLLPVLRELGLVTIFWDVNVSHVDRLFDERGALTDPALLRRSQRFFDELIWMSSVLREGRERDVRRGPGPGMNPGALPEADTLAASTASDGMTMAVPLPAEGALA